MSLGASFYTALSGMNTNGMAMQVISDNISNSNTVGFKSTSTQFEDILGMSLEGIAGFTHMGVGVDVSAWYLSSMAWGSRPRYSLYMRRNARL